MNLDFQTFIAGLDSPNHSPQSREAWCRQFFHDMQLVASPEALDVVWRDAEAMLPSGWALSVVGAFDGSGYLCSAMSRAGRSFALTGRPTEEGEVVEGETVVDALLNLMERLFSTPKEPQPPIRVTVVMPEGSTFTPGPGLIPKEPQP